MVFKKRKLYLPSIGTLAQLVEQRTENPCVPGSIPGGTTLKPCNHMIIRVLICLFQGIVNLIKFKRVLINQYTQLPKKWNINKISSVESRSTVKLF